MVRSWRSLIPLAAVAGLLTAGPALAAGGGGGGMDMPSTSAPAYDPAAEYQKGVAALQGKDYKAAERAFRRVTEAAPKNGDGWRMLGVSRTGQNDSKGARRAFERAVKIDGNDIVARQGLGVSLVQLKETDKARGELDWLKARAAACAKTCPEAAALDSAAGAVERALAGAAPAAALPSSLLFAGPAAGDGAYLAAVGLINERRYGEALAQLDAARRAFGPHPDVLTYQGYTHRKLGDFATAEGYYRAALDIAPDHRGATEYYGELMVERGDLAGAKLMLAKLDRLCDFGCAEAEELRRWIDAGSAPRS